MQKALLVGQVPSKRGNGQPAVSGGLGSAARLSKLIGMPVLDAFDAVNLLDGWPGKQGKGDAFPAGAAKDKAVDIAVYDRHQVLILMGRRVAAAFRVCDLDYFGTTLLWSKRVYLFPHPSGVNRWWNDEENVAEAGRFLRKFVRRNDG